MSSARGGLLGMLGFILFVLFFVGATADINFVLSRNEGTWQQASVSCKSIRGSLAILDNVQLQKAFDRDIKPAPGERIWVGRYVGYSQTVTIDGCYRNKSLEMKRSKVLVNNYLVTCLRECQDTAYVGLQGQFCHCIEKIPPQEASVPGVYCRRKCPGETNSGTKFSWCGSQASRFNTVSVYRRIKAGEIQLDPNVRNLGECIAYNAKANNWLPLDCNQPKLFTCDKLQCSSNAPPSMCVIPSGTLNTWNGARFACEGSSSRLATVNLTTNNYFKKMVMFNDPVYWTAFHRKQVIVWSYDSSPKDIEQSDRCFVAIKQNGKWNLVVDWCKNQHKYACVQEDQSTTSPTTSGRTTRPSKPKITRPVTQTTVSMSTSENLPTVNPFATPLSVTASAGNHFNWINNLMSIFVVQIVTINLNIRYFNIF